MKGNNQHYPSRSILINDGLRKLGGGGCRNLKKEDDDGDDGDDDDDDDNNEVVDCSFFILKPDCDALQSGQVPSSDGTAGATLNLEITTYADGAIEKLDRALNEAILTEMKCSTYGYNRELQNTNDALQVTLNGYTVGELSKVRNVDCSKSRNDCSVYQTPFTIYYSGNPTSKQLKSFISGFKDAVKNEVEDDEYTQVTEVHRVYIDSNLAGSESLTGNMSVGAKVGTSLGGLVLLGIAAGLMYKVVSHFSLK